MHLTSQMQRFTHETQNIKSMIANFKSEVNNQEVVQRSKSGIKLHYNQDSQESIQPMRFAKKEVSRGENYTSSRRKSSSQLRHSIYLDKEHINKKSTNLNPKFGLGSGQIRPSKEEDENESMRETLNLNFAGMEKIKQKIESTKTNFGGADMGSKPRRHKSQFGGGQQSKKNNKDKLNFKWEFSKKRGTDNNIRVETNLLKKNKSASRLGKKTPLQKFLEEQTKKMPRWDGSRFVDSSNKNILKLDSKVPFDSARKKKSRVKARMEQMDVELGNYKNFKKDIEQESSRQKEESEAWADDSKASIKLMLVNNYIQDDESESDNDNQQILKDLNSGDAFKKKDASGPEIEQEEAQELVQTNDKQPPSQEREGELLATNDYQNIFRDFEIYSLERQNLLSLKACSLFNKNKLVENEFLDVWCDTKKTVSRSTWEVTLLLTFAPKKPNLVISTRLLTFEAIEAFPSFINEFSFDNPVGQTFSIKMMGIFKPIDFPKVQINLHTPGNQVKITRFELPLPFSINKFVSHRHVSDSDLIEYVQNSIELASEEFALDEDYLVRASDLLEILPELVVFDENLFCMFLDFGSDMTAAVKLEVLQRLEIRVTLYSHQNAGIFHDYLKWFLWMFKK